MEFTEYEVMLPVTNNRAIGATVALPRTEEPVAAVALAGGSLSHRRNGELDNDTPHGRGRDAIRRWAHRLAAAGYASIRWDRPGYGSSIRGEGTPPGNDDHADALQVAYDHLATSPRVHYNRVFIAGESAGAYYACWLARRGVYPCGYLLLGALVSSYERLFEFNYTRTLIYARRSRAHWDWVLQVAPRALANGLHFREMFARARAGDTWYELAVEHHRWRVHLPTLLEELEHTPLSLFDHLRGPALVLQGDRDMNVPPGDGAVISERLNVLGQTRVTHITVPGGDHNYQAAPDDYEERLRERIDLSCLTRPYLDSAYDAALAWLSKQI